MYSSHNEPFIYGTKQAGRLWQNTLRDFLKSQGFKRLPSDSMYLQTNYSRRYNHYWRLSMISLFAILENPYSIHSSLSLQLDSIALHLNSSTGSSASLLTNTPMVALASTKPNISTILAYWKIYLRTWQYYFM